MKNRILLFIVIAALSLNLCGCYQPTGPISPETTPQQSINASTEPEPTITAPPVTEPIITEPEITIPHTEPADNDFVKVTDYIPDIVTDLRYATENNFTGQVIYDFQEPWLRYGTVKKLMNVQNALSQSGYRLKIWDAFRPTAAQFRLWEICPDSTYVANPHNGFSSHSRGNTIDITIVYSNETEVLMPTAFDDFSKLADRDYSDCPIEAAQNAAFLEEIMTSNGFTGYWGEWWHYSDTATYPVEHNFQPAEKE